MPVVGEPKGGGLGSSDHFGTPAAPEEWFWLSGVNRGGWVGNGRLVSQKGGVFGSVTILTPVSKEEWFWLPAVDNG